MPRILFDARALAEPSGGISRVAARILEHLRNMRPEAEIVVMTTGWRKGSRDDQDAQDDRDQYQAPQQSPEHSDRPDRPMAPLHLRLPNKLWSLFCLLGITSLDRAAERMTGRPFDELVLPNVGFVGTPRIPYTIVVHDLSFLIEPQWFPWKMRVWHHAVRASRLIRNASHIWCVSETTARDAERLLGVKHERISVLMPDVVAGMDITQSHEGRTRSTSLRAGSSSPTERYVLAFGGNNPRKNVTTAIAAVERVRENERFKDLKLIVIGGANRPTDEELAELYRNASALLYPSWYEGFGLPLYEAASYKIPILASSHGALPETAPPGVTLINPAKPHLWASALRNILILGST